MIGWSLISPSPPSPLRHFTSAACSTSTGSGHFEGPHDEDIPRVHFAKLPIFDGNGPISKLFPLYRGEFVLAQISPSPSDIFLHPLMILTLPLPLLSFSLKRHILHTSQSDGTRSPTGPLFFSFLLALVSSVASSRGHPVVRTSSATWSVFFFFAFPVGNQISV